MAIATFLQLKQESHLDWDTNRAARVKERPRQTDKHIEGQRKTDEKTAINVIE